MALTRTGQGCGCFTCRRHTRGYIHHLLNTHEMLADVLLAAHNTVHYAALFAAARTAIAAGTLPAYRAAFAAARVGAGAAPPAG